MSALLFHSPWLPDIVARIFAERPDETIWQWADKDNVFLDTTMAAEPGFYRSAKTPWTRRIQEICQRPFYRGRRIRKIVVKKASQTGYTEAVLNVIRWFVKYWPRNVIYSIDTAEEAGNIRDRLVKTLEHLGEEIFTGDEDDIAKLKLTLRYMLVWFYGSFAPGKFANKQAPFGVVDEAAAHKNGQRSVGDVESRTKTSEDGLVVVISKPEDKGDVIDKEHELGNQEIYLVPCPFCGTYQALTLEKLTFGHCKNMFGEWDLDRVLNDTGTKCEATGRDDNGELICGKVIPESHKPWMVGVDESDKERGYWLATHDGDPKCDPEVISQEMSDLYSLNASVSWGRLAIKIIQTKRNREARKVVWTQNFAKVWEEHAAKTEVKDVLKCKGPYRRGVIPWTPLALLLGSDVGQSYAKWAAAAIVQRIEKSGEKESRIYDVSVIDYGNELHPAAIAQIVRETTFPCLQDGKRYGFMHGGMDPKYRHEDVYETCMSYPGRLWPVAGGGGRLWRRSFGLGPVGGKRVYPEWLQLISFNDKDFKTELYVERIKRQVPDSVPPELQDDYRRKMPRLLVPEDVTTDYIDELTKEHLEKDEDTDEMTWVRHGPNHYGDCTKIICVLWRFILRGGIPEQEKAA